MQKQCFGFIRGGNLHTYITGDSLKSVHVRTRGEGLENCDFTAYIHTLLVPSYQNFNFIVVTGQCFYYLA